MSVITKPQTVTRGLVFYYDMLNSKSWKGAPTVNTMSSGVTSIHTSWNNSGTATWSNDDTTIPRLYPTLPVMSMYKDTAGNSHIAHGYSTLSNGVTYTVSTHVYIPSNAGTLASSVPYMRTFPANTGRGELAYLGSTNWNTWPRDRWIRVSGTFTNSANDTEMYISCYLDNAGNKIAFTAPMIEVGSYSTPYVNGTRSNTQAILDILGQRTVTAQEVTYSSNNTFSFNNIANWCEIGSLPAQTNAPLSVFSWVYLNATPTGVNGIWGHYGLNYGSGNVNCHFETYSTYTRIRLGDINNSSLPVMATGTWVNAGFTSDGSTHIYYVNGVQQATWSGNTGTLFGANTNMFGRSDVGRTWNGRIDALQIYNQQLSAIEVKQNFDALRGRYGL